MFIYLPAFLDTGLPRGNVHERDSDPMRGVPSLPNPTTREGWPHHRGLQPLLFPNGDVGSFSSHKSKSVKVLWDGTYGFLSLSEKTRKSNYLQMSLQRQQFLLSYHECWPSRGLNPSNSHSADWHSLNWANQAAVCYLIDLHVISCLMTQSFF